MSDPFATSAPEQAVRRDQWGRYKVVPPAGGKPTGYTRATTVAKSLDNQDALIAWKARMTALGLVARHDIYASVAAADPTDKTALNTLCERAAEAGGATTRRDLGTAIHRFVELAVTDPTYAPPDAYAGDVKAVVDALAAHGLEPVDGASEQMVVLDSLQIAGTYDLVLRETATGRLLIGDLKTGAASSIKFGALAWAIQLAIYAAADAIYTQGSAEDGSEDTRTEPLPVDSDHAVVLHTEPGSGTCAVHLLDIARGRQALDVAMSVREWRKAKGFIVPYAPPAADPALVEWIRARVVHVVESGGQDALGSAWPPEVPTLRENPTPTDAQIQAIAEACGIVEADLGLPFGPTDPRVTARAAEATAEAWSVSPAPDTPGPEPQAPTAHVDALVARLEVLPSDLVTGIRVEVRAAGVGNLYGGVTPAQLALVAGRTSEAEAAWEARKATINSHAQDVDDDVWMAAQDTLDVAVAGWTADAVETLTAILSACDAGLVGIAYRDGDEHPYFVPSHDALDRLVDTHGGKRQVLAAAKALRPDAPPKSSDEAAADPVLVAQLTASPDAT